MKRWLMMAALLAGCGGSGTKEQFTCDVNTASVNTCTVAQVESSKVSEFMSSCTSLGGSISTDPCMRDNPFGVCNGEKVDGITASVTAYPSSTISTQEGAATACANEGGTWLANANYGTAYECGTSVYCAQFGDLSASQQANASSYCEQFGQPAVTSGQCSTTAVVGTCATTTSDAGPVVIYVYSGDAAGDQSNCEQYFHGTWTMAS